MKIKKFFLNLLGVRYSDIDVEKLIKENETLKASLEEKAPADLFLQKYVRKTCYSKVDTCEKILGSDESLKRFAKLWDEDKEGVVMMMTSMEYEFVSNREFTASELATLRHVIGNISMFFKNASEEWNIKQILRAKHN